VLRATGPGLADWLKKEGADVKELRVDISNGVVATAVADIKKGEYFSLLNKLIQIHSFVRIFDICQGTR